MKISELVKTYGPGAALAVAQATGAEDAAIDKLLDRVLPAADRPLPTADYDAERWDGMS